MLSFPDVVALGRVEQPHELAAVEHVGQRLALLRRPQDERVAPFAGPKVIALPEATVVVPDGWRGAGDDAGTLVLERGA